MYTGDADICNAIGVRASVVSKNRRKYTKQYGKYLTHSINTILGKKAKAEKDGRFYLVNALKSNLEGF